MTLTNIRRENRKGMDLGVRAKNLRDVRVERA